MGPWGPTFDALTWQPWAPPPSVLLAKMDGTSELVPLASLPARPDGTARVVVISDTHGKHEQCRLPAGDLLVHCGDVLSRNGNVGLNSGRAHRRALAQLRSFNRWLERQPHTHCVVVGGNHDGALESLGRTGAASLLSHATWLEDEVAQVGPLRVAGSPWSAAGSSANRAWQGEAPRLLNAISAAAGHGGDGERLDLLVTHKHHKGLAAALRPTVYACGHEHEQHGVRAVAGGGVQLNASVCDGLYRNVQPPVVIDVPVPRQQA